MSRPILLLVVSTLVPACGSVVPVGDDDPGPDGGDTTAPGVAWQLVPASPGNDASPVFEFTASEPAELFCSLDGRPAGGCTSPHALVDLADGDHTFAVHAVDAAANVGGAATHDFTIDTAAPAITIVASAGQQQWTFSLTASEPLAGGFECGEQIGPASDGLIAWFACTSPHTGSYPCGATSTFHARGTDPAGNLGQESRTFTPDCANGS